MKKSFLLAAAFVITLGACTQDDDNLGNEITFKSYAQKSTKAGFYGPMITATYDTLEHFGVYAFLKKVDNSWASNNFMTNVEIERTGSSPSYVWKNISTTYYWPSNDSLRFACYSPYGFKSNGETDANIVSASYDKGIKFTDFTAPNDNNEQIDLMVADLIGPKSSASSAVSVNFKHILSQIKFTAETKTDFSPTTDNVDTIVIDTIIVHSLQTVGTYVSEDGTFANGSWSGLSITANYSIPGKGIRLNTTLVDLPKPILVLPQDARTYKWNDGVSDKNIFEITYTITFKDGDNTNESKKTVYIQPTEIWEKGKIYTYHLQIGLNEITFAPAVEVWSDGTTPDNNDL